MQREGGLAGLGPCVPPLLLMDSLRGAAIISLTWALSNEQLCERSLRERDSSGCAQSAADVWRASAWQALYGIYNVPDSVP